MATTPISFAAQSPCSGLRRRADDAHAAVGQRVADRPRRSGRSAIAHGMNARGLGHAVDLQHRHDGAGRRSLADRHRDGGAAARDDLDAGNVGLGDRHVQRGGYHRRHAAEELGLVALTRRHTLRTACGSRQPAADTTTSVPPVDSGARPCVSAPPTWNSGRPKSRFGRRPSAAGSSAPRPGRPGCRGCAARAWACRSCRRCESSRRCRWRRCAGH